MASLASARKSNMSGSEVLNRDSGGLGLRAVGLVGKLVNERSRD